MKVSRESEVSDIGFAELVGRVRDAIRRRWRVLVIVSLAIFIAGATVVMMLPKQYMATARVRIDPSRSGLPDDQANEAFSLSPEAIETEVAAIRSLEIGRKVVRQQHLTSVTEFADGVTSTLPGAAGRQDVETQVANNVLNALSVNRDKLTYILGIGVTTKDPILSARVANAFVKAYVDTKLGSKTGTAERQAAWYKRRLDVLGADIQATDERVAQYRAQAGISQSSTVGGTGTTITDQQIGPLSSQLAMAQSDAAAARSNLAAAEAQAARGGVDSVSEVLNSPVIGNLRAQRADVLRNMGEVQARYGDRHPESIRVHDQLAGIDKQLKDEMQRVIGSLRTNANAADARAASLEAAMTRLAGQQADNTRSAVLADNLERQSQAKRDQFNKLSQMSLQSTQAATNEIPQAEVVDAAKPPAGPTSPNRPLLLALVLVVAIAGGASTVTVQEMMVTGFRTIDEIEDKLDLAVLAAVPNIPRDPRPADLLLKKPTSLFSESLRIARASLLGVKGTNAPKIIAITSSLPSEGKTTTALALARTLATNNARTLLFECDVRRAVMRNAVGQAPTGPGTVELLQGQATLEQTITPGDVPGLDHLLVKEPHFSSGDLFGNGEMERVLNELRNRYDIIVLDLPPIIGLADGRFIAALADTTALVVRWDDTPTDAAATAVSWLRSDGANVAGVILTMVDTGAEAIGGLYYSEKYSKYYS